MFDKAIHRATHSLHAQNMPNFATGKLYFSSFSSCRCWCCFLNKNARMSLAHDEPNTIQRANSLLRVEMVYFGSLVLLISRLYPICSHVLCVYVCNDKPTLCSLKHPSVETTGTQWRGERMWGGGFVSFCYFHHVVWRVCVCVRARVSACAQYRKQCHGFIHNYMYALCVCVSVCACSSKCVDFENTGAHTLTL